MLVVLGKHGVIEKVEKKYTQWIYVRSIDMTNAACVLRIVGVLGSSGSTP